MCTAMTDLFHAANGTQDFTNASILPTELHPSSLTPIYLDRVPLCLPGDLKLATQTRIALNSETHLLTAMVKGIHHHTWPKKIDNFCLSACLSVCFQTRVSLCNSPGCLGPHFVDHAILLSQRSACLCLPRAETKGTIT